MSYRSVVGLVRVMALLLALAAVAVALWSKRPEAATGLLACSIGLVIMASSIAERGMRGGRSP